MEEKFISKALEANLAETRYKDIKIPADYQLFINLSKTYFGINKRANDCIIEFQHPFSNKKFVAEELRSILLTDYWFYIGLENPEKAFEIPLKLLRNLLLTCDDTLIRQMIIRSMFEFIQKITLENKPLEQTVNLCFESLREGFVIDPMSFVISSRFFKRYLGDLSVNEMFSSRLLDATRTVYQRNLEFWRDHSTVGHWLEDKKSLLTIDPEIIEKQIGTEWFGYELKALDQINDWNELVETVPDYDQVSDRFAGTIELFPTFIEKFYFIFYLLKLAGMQQHRERLIWRLNKILQQTIDEIEPAKLDAFIDKLFEFAQELRKEHASSVLDMLLTLGKKVIDLGNHGTDGLVSHFENKLINFGFETPGMVYVNEDWQLSVNSNHIKNIRVWLELIEHSHSEMEKLLSTLIVNLQLGGIFISDTDLFQREITKILNSNIAPYYKKVKQLTRIFPVFFNEIGAEGDIRKVTTTMDEISQRQDILVHFLRKQVHTESNNTLIGLTRRIFIFWYDGKLEKLRDDLPLNVYNQIDKKSEWFAPIHKLVVKLCEISGNPPEKILALSEVQFDELIGQLPPGSNRDKERLRDIRRLYSFLKEKYSFEAVDITEMLRRYSFIEEKEISKLKKALESNDIEVSLKLIYSFMSRLKEIIFNPKPSQSWENIYHKRHIAIGIPSMYGIYREPKFEALGLTFRLENVATRLMEKVVEQINLNYISARTLSNIYIILDYFREGLELDGITNQSFNANLLMLKYSLRSQSFSFDQYINIFQFIAEDVKRTIIKYFLKTYEVPLRIVIPQLNDRNKTMSEKQLVEMVNKGSEKFYRDVIADAFLMQPLDNFISRILESLREMADNLPPDMIREIMSYNSDLIITRLRKPDPRIDNQVFLGSKAYHLKNLRIAGLPVPAGFVITTEVFRRQMAILGHPELKKEMHELIHEHLLYVEKNTGKQFGNPKNPLLLSVRSGAAISMPGAMDTILNVGMNDEITESMSRLPEFSWSAWDSYRRLLQSWGMAFGMSRDEFDQVIDSFKKKYKVDQKVEFSPPAMKEIAMAYKKSLSSHNIVFEEDVFKQLLTTINMVFTSWSSDRAKVYRKHLEIAGEWGTAVIVQRMIFGNLRRTSGTGVVFTQNPKMKKQSVNLYGDFTLCSQGEDIVAGLVKPLPVSKNQLSHNNPDEICMETHFPEIYKKIHDIAIDLTENHGYSPQEIEFTFESEKPEDLFILQTRDMDMATFYKVIVFSTPINQMKLAGRGIGVGGSAMNGRVAFDMKDIERIRKEYKGENVVLVRPDTVPDDIGMIFATDGLLTAKGGATSHAAVTAVRLGKTSVVNCTSLTVFDNEKRCQLGQYHFQAFDLIAIDGYLGNIYQGNYPIEEGQNYEEFRF